MVNTKTICFLCLFAVIVTPIKVENLKIWVATWNVADNKQMDGKLDNYALKLLLGLNDTTQNADVYAVSLQENCYLCNSGNKEKLANEFLKLLNNPTNLGNQRPYTYIGTSMTRDSSVCETVSCNVGLHGTVLTMVLARQGVIRSSSIIKNTQCKTGLLGFGGNEEKGVAGIKVILNTTTSLCFAGLHLDSDSNSVRKSCMKHFFQDKSFINEWTKGCNHVYLLGDFNTRTQYADQKGITGRLIGNELYSTLSATDEMHYTVGKSDALLSYINQLSQFKFQELASIHSQAPTYSLLSTDKCVGKSSGLCYRADRPPSWCDRILCSGCLSHQIERFSVLHELQRYSDHLPVVGFMKI